MGWRIGTPFLSAWGEAMSHPEVSPILQPLSAFTAVFGEDQLNQAVWVLGRANASNFPGIPVTPATGSCHRGPRAGATAAGRHRGEAVRPTGRDAACSTSTAAAFGR